MKDPFIYIPEIGLSSLHENEITTPTEFKIVEFDSTNPGINTDEGFFFFNLKTKHCGEFLYRTFNKKAFVDFGNQLEINHKGPYRIEVIKDTIYICSTPELYDPAIHAQDNPAIIMECTNCGKIIYKQTPAEIPLCDKCTHLFFREFNNPENKNLSIKEFREKKLKQK